MGHPSSIERSDRFESLDMSETEFRSLGHELIEAMWQIFSEESKSPVLPRVSGEESAKRWDIPLPNDPSPSREWLHDAGEKLRPHARKNGHPRFWGYVCSSADPIGALADAYASALNQNLTAWRSAPGAVDLERMTIRWLAQLIGLPESTHGLLVSGGSSANFTALSTAIHKASASPSDGSKRRHSMTAYLSQETHLSLTKAFRVLGLSDSHVRRVSIDGERRMNAKALADWIDDDRAAGLHPVCVCASSGTANTGAIDPLSDIADVCEERGLWMHVDGAYGAPIAMLEEFEWVSRALKRASSVSLDPHKWLFAPIDVGCVMFRSPDETRSTFSEDAAYTRVEQDKKNESFAFFDHGLELTRRARALKVWAILRTRGRRQLESIIRQNIALRQHLDERIAKEAHLQRLGSGLSISCFRWWESSLEEKQLNAINQDIINTLNNEGECFMSPTVLEGRLALRVCIVNFRTRREDIDWLIERILKIATP